MTNPYQSPLPDGFMDDTIMGYEETLEAYIRLVNSLRDRVRKLEGERRKCVKCGAHWKPMDETEPPALCPECDFEKYRSEWQAENDRLRAENERLKWQLVSPAVTSEVVLGCHMEGADID